MNHAVSNRVFGTLPDGTAVEALTLRGGGLRAEVLTWGALVRDLRMEGHTAPLVLGFERLKDYLTYARGHGATVGRCANRIAGGRFVLDGVDWQLERNERGNRTHIHGGSQGIGRRVWDVAEQDEDRVVLRVRDPEGQAGYPGNLDVTCTITLVDSTLRLVYESRTDAPTLANIAHHGYFNLDGGDTIRAHTIRIDADHYLPVDDLKIPTGEIAPVEGTPFDLREATAIGARMDATGVSFDHNFCLSRAATACRPVAWVTSPASGIAMEVATTEPGVQFFAAVPIDIPAPVGLEGRRYGPAAGLCLEAQIWPDAVNHEGFPAVILRPGEVRVQQTDYRFTRG